MAESPSFPRFNSLPQEIRLMIWEAALPGPRIVHIECRNTPIYRCYRVRSDVSIDSVDSNGDPAFFALRGPFDRQQIQCMRDDSYISREESTGRHFFTTSSPPPTILHVCHESFAVASKHYSRILGTEYQPPQVYFDFTQDILYLDWGSPWRSVNLNPYSPKEFSWVERAKVQHLAFEFQGVTFMNNHGFRNHEVFTANVLSYFLNVRKATISRVGPFHPIEESRDLVFMRPLPKDIRRFDYLLGEIGDQDSVEEKTEYRMNVYDEREEGEFDSAESNDGESDNSESLHSKSDDQESDDSRSENEESADLERVDPERKEKLVEWFEKNAKLFQWFRDAYEPREDFLGLEMVEGCRSQCRARQMRRKSGDWDEVLSPMPEIDCQIITTPAIRDQLVSLEAAMAEAVEWKCCGDMSACTCTV